MTYCVGLLVDTGLVMLSDSRTNAGVDQITTFRKMATFPAPDRVLVLLSAGNLAITQAVVNLLHDAPAGAEAQSAILQASDMFKAARVVGEALRVIHERDAESLKDQGHEFNGTFILAGRSRARSRGCSTSTPPAISSSPPATRRTFRSANRSTASP